MHKTAIVTDRSYSKHFAGRSHPERPARIEAMIEMAESLRRPGLQIISPRAATLDEIALCHGEEYIAAVERTSHLDRFDFDPDTHTSRDTYATAILAAGGVLTAVESGPRGAAENAFAIVRPPGHHALPNRAMGFCFFNNLAIAASWLIQKKGLKRVMVIDWDLHHGNGTQNIFYDSAQLLYTSTHQFPHYPGTGSFQEMGADEGSDTRSMRRCPRSMETRSTCVSSTRSSFRSGTNSNPSSSWYLRASIVTFAIRSVKWQVTENGFQQMMRRIMRLAAETCDGKIVAALEGGYNLEAITNSGKAVIEEMGRDAGEPFEMLGDGARAIPIIERIRHGVGQYWNLK